MRSLQPWWKLPLQHIVLSGNVKEIDGQFKPLYGQYYPGRCRAKIKENTIFWHAPGRYSPEKQLAGIYLKGVIDPYIQSHTFYTMHKMKWRKPKRGECLPAIALQGEKGLSPGEFPVGAAGSMLEYCTAERQLLYIRHLEPILRQMDLVFQTVLPKEYHAQTNPLPLEERRRIVAEAKDAKSKDAASMGGIPAQYRLFLTCFSTLALLRNCPTAIHRDQYNANQNHVNYSCITTVGKYKGGGFCLPAYELRIPVGPGDLLICQTNREYHCNIGRVTGEKYSIVAYYKTRTARPDIGLGRTRKAHQKTKEQKALFARDEGLWAAQELSEKLKKESDERIRKKHEEWSQLDIKVKAELEAMTPEELAKIEEAFAKAEAKTWEENCLKAAAYLQEAVDHAEAMDFDLECIGEEPSDDELIEDERRRREPVK